MAQLTELRRELREYLARQLEPEVTVTDEYPGSQQKYPQRKPCIALGIASISTAPGGYLGEQEGGLLQGQNWQLTLRLELSCPRQGGAVQLAHLFERVAALLLEGSGFDIIGLTCGRTHYSRERDGFYTFCSANCMLSSTTLQPGGTIEAFEIRRKL